MKEKMEEFHVEGSEEPENNEPSFQISGRPITFKTGDVAKMLNETPAMIRYYCREFEEFMGFEHNPGEHRVFTKKEIEYLRYIIYLVKEKNLSVKQAKEFLSTPQGKLMEPLKNEEDKAKIFVEVLSEQLRGEIAKIVRNEISLAFKEMQQPLLTLSSSIEENAKLNEDLSKNIEKLVEQTLKDNEDVKQKINEIITLSENETKGNETIEEKLNQIDSLSETVRNVDQFISEFRLKKAESGKEQPKKGFFARLFGK